MANLEKLGLAECHCTKHVPLLMKSCFDVNVDVHIYVVVVCVAVIFISSLL